MAGTKNIAIKEDTYQRLYKLKIILTAKHHEIYDFDKTIRWLLELAEEKLGEEI